MRAAAARPWYAPDVVVASYLAVLLLAVVQTVVLGAPARTLAAALPFLIALVVVLGIRANVAADVDAVGTWLSAVTVGGTALGAWATARFLLALPDHWGQPHGYYRLKVEVTTPLGDHNTAAGLLLVVIVAAVVLAVRDPRWAIAVGLAVVGTIATLSRGAAVVLLAAAAGAWLVRAERRVRWWLTACAVAVFGGIMVWSRLLDASAPPGAADPDGPLGASVVGRYDLAVRGVEVGLDHPMLGTGLGSFVEVAEGLPPPNDHAHQLFAHAFAEGGVVLLVVAALLPFVLAVRAWRLPASPVRTVALVGGGALVLHAQLEILGGRLGYELLLACLLGLVGPGSGPARADGRGRLGGAGEVAAPT